MGIQISCVCTAYKKFQTPRETRGADQSLQQSGKGVTGSQKSSLLAGLEKKTAIKPESSNRRVIDKLKFKHRKHSHTYWHAHIQYTFIEKHEVVKWLKNTINNRMYRFVLWLQLFHHNAPFVWYSIIISNTLSLHTYLRSWPCGGSGGAFPSMLWGKRQGGMSWTASLVWVKEYSQIISNEKIKSRS